jgi:tRNA (guanine37-N1)-methyltransferase
MRLDILTIFPAYLEPLRLSLVGKAIDTGILDVRIHDVRDHAHDRHRTVDDTPYGGGPGMVMKPDVWGECIDAVLASEPDRHARLVIPTPSGRTFRQVDAHTWAQDEWLIIACGRYEGIDSRVAQHFAAHERIRSVDEVSIGDYVLAGGEVAALVVVEAVARLLPGVLGNEVSSQDDSFSAGLSGHLEGPVFTKPAQWRGLEVPEILLSGDHARIAAWRREQGVERTRLNRPDLLGSAPDS